MDTSQRHGENLVLRAQHRTLTREQTTALDRVLTHPFWGLIILIGILGATMIITYTAALPAANWLQSTVVLSISSVLNSLLAAAPVWLRVVIVDGMVAGVGTVLSFVPILLVFFTILALLEESRYLTRASRVTDRYLQWLGLPGKACIPLSMGFGCNTSAILGCRILEERRSRLLTMLLVPFVPCTSRLAVIALLATAFFGSSAMWITWGLISFNLIVLASIGFLANRIRPRQKLPDTTLMLPPYQIPESRAVGRNIWKNMLDFLGKARGLVIFSAIIWTLSYFPTGIIENSYLARFGQSLTPVGSLAGMDDWRLIVALLSSLASKENAVAVMGVLFPLASGSEGISAQVALALSPAGRMAFLVMQMLFIPCASTLAAMRHESGSWKLAIIETALMTLLSFIAGLLVFQIGSRLF